MLRKEFFASILFILLVAVPGFAQQPGSGAPANPGPPVEPKAISTNDSVLVTVILKHQQDKSLPEIRRILEAQGFWDVFPPQDARIVSWTLAIGLGHVVILEVPANAVRRLNLALGNGAWGAFDTEIYLSYDYQNLWQEYIEKREEAKDDRN